MENQLLKEDLAMISSMTSRLFNEGQITNEEKIEMEKSTDPRLWKALIFDVIFRKELNAVEKLFLTLKSAQLKHKARKQIWLQKTNNACGLKQKTVLRYVFEYLTLKDLKNCRGVCKVWKSEAEFYIRKHSMIMFGYSYLYERIRSPVNFLESFNFFFESPTNLLFTSFCFEALEWPISVLQNFFQNQKDNIQHLEFHEMTLVNDYFQLKEYLDISRWIADLPLNRLVISCLPHYTILGVSLSSMNSVKHIRLQSCLISVTSQNRISPETICLMGVVFWKEGDIFEEYRLNDSIDFSKTKDISIFRNDTSVISILDLSENFNANQIIIQNGKVINWSISKSSVKCLKLVHTPFLAKTEMKISELHFEDSDMDLHALPSSIEKL